MASTPKLVNNGIVLSPTELKTVFEALQIAPSYLSKRFIMTELLGWSDDVMAKNVKLRNEEISMEKMGDRAGAYK